MPKTRSAIWIALIAVPCVLVAMFVVGLFVYMNATAKPIHPDPNGVPSVMLSSIPANWTDAVARARRIVRSAVTAQNLPGASVAVGAAGTIVWAEGFGYADLDKRVRVSPDTRFRIGEVSNALTSVAAGLLLERGRLHLNDDIQVYVPEFPKKQWPVTLHELMAQVSGIGTDAGDEEPIDRHCEHAVDGLPRFSQRPLLFEPGTRFRPSTYGWILVSAAVEAAADESFFTFMRRQIFDPLRMDDTEPDSAVDPIPDRAAFYFPRFAADTRYGPELAREGDYSCFAGGGAFLSTPSDLVRFGMAVNGGKLLTPSTVKTLQTRQELVSGEPTGYGLGWKVETVLLAGAPTTMAAENSKRDFIGGSTALITFPERALVVAVASNISFANASSVAVSVAQAFSETR